LADAADEGITVTAVNTLPGHAYAGGAREAFARLWESRTKYLLGAICVALCMVMLTPLVISVLQSLKTTEEAAALPPLYYPHVLSLDGYRRLWNFQAGLPVYLFNSTGAALLTIVFCLALTIPAGYALARFPIRGKEGFFVFLLLSLIIPYQALVNPIFFMFAKLQLTNSLVGLAILHTAIQMPFSVYVMRNSFEAVPRELEEAAVMDGCNSWQVLVRVFLPAIVPAIITVSLFAFVTSWNELLGALVMMNNSSTFTLPLALAIARTQTSIGGTDWGMLQAGITISIIPSLAFYLLLQKYYVSGFLSGAVK
jgi:multiple sugar transport system permease protein